jgi:FkbM family methyltransferase
MGFTSYAGNHEDVLLYRALGGVDRGFYIDIGAGDPTINSVSKAFYAKGWSGINVEPVEFRYQRLVQERSRDVNLRAACSDKEGEVTFFTVEGYDELSTLFVDAVELAPGLVITEAVVESRSLASICYEHVEGEIHFLKIDVEGAEVAVLAGADFEHFRPWIVAVEIVSPYTRNSDESAINEALVAARYRPALFDGVNRFYVADERYDELAPALSYPVCVRDNFVASDVRSATALAGIADKLGTSSVTDEHEILTRLDALFEDRVAFEHSFDEATSTIDLLRAERDEQARVMAALAHEHESRVADLERKHKAALNAMARERDALLFRSFERERYLAVQRNDVARQERGIRLSEDRIAELETALTDVTSKLNAVLTSTSWRISLPMRVVRRPLHYLRHVIRRAG